MNTIIINEKPKCAGTRSEEHLNPLCQTENIALPSNTEVGILDEISTFVRVDIYMMSMTDARNHLFKLGEKDFTFTSHLFGRKFRFNINMMYK